MFTLAVATPVTLTLIVEPDTVNVTEGVSVKFSTFNPLSTDPTILTVVPL